MSNLSVFPNTRTYFILNNTWNIFYYVFRSFGVYPCVRDEEHNSLKPRSTFRIWVHFICTSFIVNTIFAWTPMFYIVFVEMTPNEYLEKISHVMFHSKTTAIVMICNFGVYFYLGLYGLSKLRNLSIGLSEFQNYFNSHSQIVLNEEKITAHMKKQHLYTILIFMVACCGLTFFNIFVSLELKLSLVLTIIHIIGAVVSCVSLTLPIMYFILIYFEIIIFLSSWYDWIETALSDNSFIKEAKIFIDGLNLINNIFSHFLFSIISAFLVFLVIIAYNLFATLWDRNNFYLWQFHATSSVLNLFSLILLLYVLCTLSESIAKKVKLIFIKSTILEEQTNSTILHFTGTKIEKKNFGHSVSNWSS